MLEQNQLTLNIQLRDDAIFSSFYPGENLEALNAIKRLVRNDGSQYELQSDLRIELKNDLHSSSENFIYIWGSPGVGKSHLLQGACHEVNEAGLSAVYIPFKNLGKISPEILDELEKVSLICLDDINCVIAHDQWEEALFHFYNRVREQKGKCKLIVSADISPLHIQLKLADLKSRLAWGITYQIHSMSDEQKLEVLRLRAHRRGFKLTSAVAGFLLKRCSRNMQELFNILEKLDQASLSEQRGLTIPFVKQVLNI